MFFFFIQIKFILYWKEILWKYLKRICGCIWDMMLMWAVYFQHIILLENEEKWKWVFLQTFRRFLREYDCYWLKTFLLFFFTMGEVQYRDIFIFFFSLTVMSQSHWYKFQIHFFFVLFIHKFKQIKFWNLYFIQFLDK